MSIAPSKGVGYSLENSPDLLSEFTPTGRTTAVEAGEILQEAYLSMSPRSAAIPAVPGRLKNKLAYTLHNTSIELRFYHQNFEPPIKMTPDGTPLGPYLIGPLPYEYAANELGRQDLITVKVKHNLALLPGPGRLLAQTVASPDGKPDKVSSGIHANDTVYYYPLEASAALNLEGEKSEIPYVY
jgi:hypothetical protein